MAMPLLKTMLGVIISDSQIEVKVRYLDGHSIVFNTLLIIGAVLDSQGSE